MVKGRRNTSQKDSGDYLQTLLAETVDIVLVIDDGGYIRFANPAAEKVIMPHLGELTGAHFGIPAMEGKFQFTLLGEPHAMALMQVSRLGNDSLVTIREPKKLLAQDAIESAIAMVDRVGTWRLDLTNNQLWWSDLAREVLGFQETLSPKFDDFLSFIDEEAHAKVRKIVDRKWAEGDICEFDLPLNSGAGDKVWVHILCQPEFYQGTLVALQGTFHDITKQHEAENRLLTSKQQFKNVYDNSINALGLCDVISDENGSVVDLIVVYINPTYEQILGLTNSDVVGKSVGELINWEDDGSLLARLNKVAQTGESIQFLYHTPVTNRHFHISTYRPADNQLAIDIKDITELINSQEALQQSEKKFRQLFEHSINGFALHELIFDEEGAPIDFRYLDVNAAFEDHTGIKRENVIGKLGSEVLPGIEVTDLIKIYSQVATTGIPKRFETFYEPLNRHYLISAFSPEPNYFATIFVDFTERKLRETIQKESEKNFRTLFNSMLQGVVYQDDKGRITGANRAAEHILGFSLEELKGLSSFDDCWKAIKMNGDPLPGPEHPAMIALKSGKAVEGYSFGVFNPKRNDIVWIDVYSVPQFHEGEDEPYQVFTTFVDITDQIRIQRALEERIKELHSLAKVSRIIQQENELEDICNSLAVELVKGLQYSELAVATIDLGGEKFTTDPSATETPYRLIVPIQMDNEVIGQISVFYTEEKVFLLPEEANLMEGVAERLGLWYKQQKTQNQLFESESRFRNAVVNAPNPIMIFADDWEIIDINDSWLSLTGYSREELPTVIDWLEKAHPDECPEIKKTLSEVFSGTINQSEKIGPVRSKSGEYLQWHLNSRVLGSLQDGRKAVISIGQDITSAVSAIREREHYYDRILALRDIDEMIISTLDLDRVLDLITQHLGNLINYDSMSILSIDGDELEVIACKGFDNQEKILNYRFPSAPGYPNYEVIKNQIPIALTDVSKEYPTFHQPGELHLPGDIKAWLGIPLFNRHEVIGMFTIDRCDEEPYTKQDIEIATQYANRAAIAITNARLFEQTNNHLRKLETLRKIDGTITSSKDVSDALHTVLEQVKVGLNVDVAAVFLYDEEEQSLAYQQSFGYRTEGNPDHKVPVGQGYVGTVADQMKPLFIPEINKANDGHNYPFSLVNEGIVSYYGFPLITKGKLQGVLQILQRSKLNPSEEWIDFAEALAGQTAIAVDNLTLFKGLEQANKELREAYDATIEGWAHALEIRDKETEGHSRRVVQLTEKVAKAYGFDDEALVHLRRGVLLHDIGKMGIPDQILHKPGPLDEAEWEIMRQHPVYANEMLKSIVYLQPALLIPHYHHERWDGSGYPEGLKGEDIPLEARIFSVVDAYDALTSDRPYRGAWSDEETIKYLKKQAGKEFDPAVVEKFLEILNKE